MAAVITIPTRSPHHDPRSGREPARPTLTVIPGGRRAARHYAASRRPAHRLHPAVYRRRRLGLVLGLVTVVVVGYLALAGVQALTADAASTGRSPSAVSAAPAAGSVYVVQPGDTVWSIARGMQPAGDIRALVDRLVDRAGPGPLQAGQALSIDGLVP